MLLVRDRRLHKIGRQAGRGRLSVVAGVLVLLCALGVQGQKRPQIEKPMAGPRGTVLRVTWLYISPDTSAQKVDRVQIGREMVIAEKSGGWMRVFANTDTEEMHSQDAPLFTDPSTIPPPVSGWIQAKGVVEETTPNGDQVLMGAAANQESLASNPRGPVNAAQSARLLYRRLVEMFPNSPLAAEAAWRAADIQWQLQKANAASLPSAEARDPYMRELLDDTELKKVIKYYPRTRQADLAAFDLLDNQMCGQWQGTEKCPEKESEVYEKYAAEHPDGPRTAEALYDAAYRQAVLANMYAADGDTKKSDNAKEHVHALADELKARFANSDYRWRTGTLVYKLDEGIPVYGIDQE
jgi:hypothetical protein